MRMGSTAGVRTASAAALALALIACGSDDGAGSGDSGVVDVRVPVPAKQEGFVDFVTAESTIEPGDEVIYCWHVMYEGPDIAVKTLHTEQGKFGHHVVMLSPDNPLPPDTVVDCTGAESMIGMRAFILPDIPLPDGYAVKVKSQTPIVIQTHYLNSGTKPILIRDVARFETVPESTVDNWSAALVINDYGVTLEPQTSTEVEFDCAMPKDLELLVLGGHMHETGTKIETFHGADDASLESVYLVDPWRSEFRDAPPVSLFFKNKRPLAKDSLIRTRCTWDNPTAQPIAYPAEMCSTFGYVAGTEEQVYCAVNEP